ncbi:MAG: histidine kinase [Streptosporangiaceae bacterium]|nr:histidine kinase [Streptosporangiaceae bacterium]
MNESLRVRIALVAGGFAALFCLVVGALVVVAVRDSNAIHGRQQIMTAIDQVQYQFRQGVFPGTLVKSGDEATQVLNAHGKVVSATLQLAGKPPMATFQPTATQIRATRTLCPPAGLKGCMDVTAYKVFRPDGPWMIYTTIPVIPWYASSTLAIFLVAVALLLIDDVSRGLPRGRQDAGSGGRHPGPDGRDHGRRLRPAGPGAQDQG